MMRSTCKIFLFTIALQLLAASNYAQQVMINFNAAIYGQSLDGLSFVQLVNSYQQDLRSQVTIRVKEMQVGSVLTLIIPNFFLKRGNNTIDRVAFSRASVSFGNNKIGLALSQSGKFPEGEYEYCFEVDASDTKTGQGIAFFENCFTQQMQPMTPLLLINPVDGDEDCNRRPGFVWQPPLPLPLDARFRLILVELKDKQDINEAINYNLPVINQGNIPVNQINFPPGLPELKLGTKYAWQVTVYTGTIVLKKSEVWIYTVKCDENTTQPSTDSYREMKETVDGDFYIANRLIRFSFSNPYNSGGLNYTIVSMADPKVVIKSLPKLVMQPGLNKYDLDLSEIKAFKDGQEYLLIVKLANNRQLKLRFIYHNE
jgi:hypothetical protein